MLKSLHLNTPAFWHSPKSHSTHPCTHIWEHTQTHIYTNRNDWNGNGFPVCIIEYGDDCRKSARSDSIECTIAVNIFRSGGSMGHEFIFSILSFTSSLHFHLTCKSWQKSKGPRSCEHFPFERKSWHFLFDLCTVCVWVQSLMTRMRKDVRKY